NDIKSFLELDSSEQFDKYMLTKSIKKQMNNIILQNKNISTLTVFSSDEKIIISENNFLSENIYEHDQNILSQIKTEDKEVNKEKNKKVTLERSLYNNTDRKSTRLNSSHVKISYAVFCLKKKNKNKA